MRPSSFADDSTTHGLQAAGLGGTCSRLEHKSPAGLKSPRLSSRVGSQWTFPSWERWNSVQKDLKSGLTRLQRVDDGSSLQTEYECYAMTGSLKRFRLSNFGLVCAALSAKNSGSGGGSAVAIFDRILPSRVLTNTIQFLRSNRSS